jgi:membrane protease YdiL (CAAX protease family)
MQVRGLIRRNPVLVYYLLTFALSWGAILVAVGSRGFPVNPAQLGARLPILIVAMLLGPGVASVLLTGIVGGRPGYRILLSRMLHWRVGIECYAAAVLVAPILLGGVPLALSILNPEFIPRIFSDLDKRSLLQLGLAAGLSVGVFEELGWTGFVIPRLRLRSGVLATGAIVGFLWGAWHIPVIALQGSTPGESFSFQNSLGALVFSFGLLPVFRVLMVWVYDRSHSLLLAMAMHMSLAAGNIIFGLGSAKGLTSPLFTLMLSAALWVVVAVIFAANRKHAPIHPLHA